MSFLSRSSYPFVVSFDNTPLIALLEVIKSITSFLEKKAVAKESRKTLSDLSENRQSVIKTDI